jgi:hypothetical protein
VEIFWTAFALLLAFLGCFGGWVGILVAKRITDAVGRIGSREALEQVGKALEEKLEAERWEWHPVVAASAFKTCLQNSDIAGAYKHVSDAFKSDMSLREFTDFVMANPFLMDLSTDFSPRAEKGDCCAIQITVEIDGELEYTYWLLLRRQPAVFNFGQVYNHPPGAWKIDEILLP